MNDRDEALRLIASLDPEAVACPVCAAAPGQLCPQPGSRLPFTMSHTARQLLALHRKATPP